VASVGLQLAFLSSVAVELALVARTDAAPQAARVGEHGVEYTLAVLACFVFKKPVKCQRRINLERGWRGR
jgi:hypothetical protein